MLAVLVCAACGTSDSGATPAADAGASDATFTCDQDPRVAAYAAGMGVASDSGALHVTLIAADPAPPVKGPNTWKVRLTDAAGQPVSGASVDVKPFMPDHGHGSSTKPTVTPGADGAYDVTGLVLFMPGVWRVTFAVTGASPADAASFFFCVPG